jgi:hypothetical protein
MWAFPRSNDNNDDDPALLGLGDDNDDTDATKEKDEEDEESLARELLDAIVEKPVSVENEREMEKLALEKTRLDAYDAEAEFGGEHEVESLDGFFVHSSSVTTTLHERFKVVEVYVAYVHQDTLEERKDVEAALERAAEREHAKILQTMRRKTISAALAQREWDSMKNWFVHLSGYVTNGIPHVELVFLVADTTTKIIRRFVSSIHYMHGLRIVDKEYVGVHWHFLRYTPFNGTTATTKKSTTESIFKKMFEMCYSRRATPFNKLGFFWNFLVPFSALRVNLRGRQTFCAEEVLMVIRDCENSSTLCSLSGVDIEPHETDPQTLIQWLLSTGRAQETREPPQIQKP